MPTRQHIAGQRCMLGGRAPLRSGFEEEQRRSIIVVLYVGLKLQDEAGDKL